MTLHPDEQAREWLEGLTYVLKIEPPLSHDGEMLIGTAIAYGEGAVVPLLTKQQIDAIVPLLARVRLQEWIAAPVHAWPDDGTTYPQEFGAELVKYRNKRIIELEASLKKLVGEK